MYDTFLVLPTVVHHFNIWKGLGLLAVVDEVIDDKTCEDRLWGMKERGESNFYMCEISREMVIDATFKGNLSRFINHSCCPNSELQKWYMCFCFVIILFLCQDLNG